MISVASGTGPGEDQGTEVRGVHDAEVLPAPLMPVRPELADRRIKVTVLRALTAGLAFLTGALGVVRVVLEWVLRPRC